MVLLPSLARWLFLLEKFFSSLRLHIGCEKDERSEPPVGGTAVSGGIDTPFIYLLEDNPTAVPRLQASITVQNFGPTLAMKFTVFASQLQAELIPPPRLKT